MKRNGFIATSILYSFFLVFITLFVSLISNYLHNQNLIKKLNAESQATLEHINKLTLADVKVGDTVVFRTQPINMQDEAYWAAHPNIYFDYSKSSLGPLISGDTKWVKAYQDADSAVFVSDSYGFLKDKNYEYKLAYKNTDNNFYRLNSSISCFEDMIEFGGTSDEDYALFFKKSFVLSGGLFDFDVFDLETVEEVMRRYGGNEAGYTDSAVKSIFRGTDALGDSAIQLKTGSGYVKFRTYSGANQFDVGDNGVPQKCKDAFSSSSSRITNYLSKDDNKIIYAYSGVQNDGKIGSSYESVPDYCIIGNTSVLNEDLTSTSYGIKFIIKFKSDGSAINDLLKGIRIDSGRGSNNAPYVVIGG